MFKSMCCWHSVFCFFSLLPDTLLHCLSCVDLLVLHRQLLADTLLMDRPTMQTAGNSHRQHSEVHTDVHILHDMHIISDEMSLYFRFSVQSSTFHLPCVVGPARLTRRSKGQMQGDEASSQFLLILWYSEHSWFFFALNLNLCLSECLDWCWEQHEQIPEGQCFVGVIPEYTCRGCWKH